MVSSPLFWVLAFALLAATLAILLVPLLRRASAGEAPADQAAAIAVFRDHKRQVEEDYAAHAITATERDAALADLAQRFGAELTSGATPAATASERPRWIAAIVLAACVPLVSGALYFALGNPTAMTAPAAASEHAIDDPKIIAMVDQLAKKLEANPDDGKGWSLLARSYRMLGRVDASVQAYAEAAKRMPPDAQLYADWAEAVAQSQGRSLVGEPTALLNRALALDPAHPKTLALLGSAAMERQDPATAAVMWKRLRAALPPDSPDLARLDEVLARVGEAKPARSAPTRAKADSVEGRVELDPKLAATVKPTDTVFIFARNPDGPRMPLAAMKMTVADLPKTFLLTDAMAMSPEATISKASKVVVEARVSKSGNAIGQSGDLAGTSGPVAPGARDVKIMIDHVVP